MTGTKKAKPDRSPETTIGRKIQRQDNGCWLWGDRADRYGRTSVSIEGVITDVVVHRFVYETLIGPIPDGHILHHKCETKGCCNPGHLVPMTPSDHMQHHAELRRVARAAA